MDEKALKTILQKQQQVVGRGQAMACGMTRGTLRYKIRPGGPWQDLFPGTYLAATGAPKIGRRARRPSRESNCGPTGAPVSGAR